MSKSPSTLADLKGARYNPRTITPLQLKKLQKSFERFGDLSGVVFNVHSGVLISGHQRTKTIKDKKTRIVKTLKNRKPDNQGTMAIGYIEVHEPDGSITKIPYREVNWSDKLAEKAANIAANAAGGEFDQAKLGSIMAELEQGQFDIELTSLDSFTTAKAIGRFKKSRDENSDDASAPSGKRGSRDADEDEDGGDSFAVVDPTAMKFAHCCPKCGYQWGDPEKTTAVSGKAKAKTATTKDVKRKASAPMDSSREREVSSSHRPAAKSKTTKTKVVKKSTRG